MKYNRQLKFRIWDKQNNIFIYVWDASHKRLAISLNGLVYSGMYDDVLPENDYTIQQYTGLKDKNGILIFEGDLVQYNQNSNYDGINFEVVWSDASFGWVLKSKTGDYLTNQITPNGPRYNFLEVIGNVFENKELSKTNE
jgi:uncharacterized phage protein (TIGR01671 family)